MSLYSILLTVERFMSDDHWILFSFTGTPVVTDLSPDVTLPPSISAQPSPADELEGLDALNGRTTSSKGESAERSAKRRRSSLTANRANKRAKTAEDDGCHVDEEGAVRNVEDDPLCRRYCICNIKYYSIFDDVNFEWFLNQPIGI